MNEPKSDSEFSNYFPRYFVRETSLEVKDSKQGIGRVEHVTGL